MRIALDVMGGDKAPEEILWGAVKARDLGIQVIAVGPYPVVHEILKKKSPSETSHIEIYHAPDVVRMDEAPTIVMKEKQNSSISVVSRLVTEGYADASVSAGNSGAFMAAALRYLRMPGILRPCFGAILPSLKDKVILLDAGANMDCNPRHLLDFAIMGEAYMKAVERKERPRIGLVNVGVEPGKGNALMKKAYFLLKNSSLNFIGNVEGRELFVGNVDVLVCDGFTGNVVLKATEGVGGVLKRVIYRELPKSKWAQLPLLMLYRHTIERIKHTLDYHEYGGAPLLGVEGVCIVAHGSSTARSIYLTLRQAKEMVENRVYELIREKIQEGRRKGIGIFSRDHRTGSLHPAESAD